MRFLIVLTFVALTSAQRQDNEHRPHQTTASPTQAPPTPSSSLTALLNQIKEYFKELNNLDYTIDYVHNYRFEEHDQQQGKHLLLAISDITGDKACHVVEISSSWESYLEQPELLHKVTEEIYQLITTHKGQETNLSRDQLKITYGDTDAVNECFSHKVYILTYLPSFGPTPSSVTTQKP